MPSGTPRIPEPREWVLHRACTECGERKPWARFSPATYFEDGTVRTVQSKCHACQSAASAKRWTRYRAENTDRVRAYQREWCRQRSAKRQEERGYSPRLPAAPFQAWLRRVWLLEESLEPLARDAGLHPDTLAKVLSRNKFVAETTADAALCARGQNLHDLYPEAA